MILNGFVPTGNSVTISATTASTANQLATTRSAAESLRVVNESGSPALVSIAATTTPDATADAAVMSVLPGTERIFGWQPNYNTVGVALRTAGATGKVTLQLGKGC